MVDWRIFPVCLGSVGYTLGKEASPGVDRHWIGLAVIVGLGGFCRVHRVFLDERLRTRRPVTPNIPGPESCAGPGRTKPTYVNARPTCQGTHLLGGLLLICSQYSHLVRIDHSTLSGRATPSLLPSLLIQPASQSDTLNVMANLEEVKVEK